MHRMGRLFLLSVVFGGAFACSGVTTSGSSGNSEVASVAEKLGVSTSAIQAQLIDDGGVRICCHRWDGGFRHWSYDGGFEVPLPDGGKIDLGAGGWFFPQSIAVDLADLLDHVYAHRDHLGPCDLDDLDGGVLGLFGDGGWSGWLPPAALDGGWAGWPGTWDAGARWW
jgi:hypothetical protein